MTVTDQSVVDRARIERAAERIASFVRFTPVLALEEGAFACPAAITLKLELLQAGGSFKARGAFNCMLKADVGPAGVIAASGGNHGTAVAYAARALGVRAEIFVPTASAAAKVKRLHEYGARVTVVGDAYADALAASRERARESGACEIHAFDDPDVVAGAATLARELETQAPGIDTVLVAVGGGGLIAGVASWYGDGVKIVAVETQGCPTLHAALRAGMPVDVPTGGVAADSLGARRIGDIAFKTLNRLQTDSPERFENVLVPEDAIALTQSALWGAARVLGEPGGVAALAALLCGAYVPKPGERVAAIVCGANLDPQTVRV